MVNLPFLKRRRVPRVQEPMAEKSVGLSSDEQLEDHCIEELMAAVSDRDPKQFRASLEALIMNAFEHGDEYE